MIKNYMLLIIYLGMIDNPADKDKFTQLYTLYEEPMFYVAYKILKNTHSAEDAVHEAFIRVIRNLHKISDVDCPQTKNYLVIIVKNVSLSMIESSESREVSMDDDSIFEGIDSGINVELDFLSKINYELIVTEIQKLPEIYKEAVYLDCVMDMDIGEIAEVLSISKEAAKKRLQRGRKLLIERLKKEAIIYEQ